MLHPHGDSVLLDHQDPSLSGVQNPGSRPGARYPRELITTSPAAAAAAAVMK